MESSAVKTKLPDPVKQFSVYMENKVGRLSDIFRLLSERNIHALALATLDTTDSSITRIVVDDPDLARELLGEHSIYFTECDILAVEIGGERDICGVLAALLEAEINVHYLYAFVSRPMGKSALAISLEDMDVAIHALTARNHKVLSQRDISR